MLEKSNNKSNNNGQNNNTFENDVDRIKVISWGNDLDYIEIKPLIPSNIDAKSDASIGSDNSKATNHKPKLMFDLTCKHKHRVIHGSLSSIMEKDVINEEYKHNNLVEFKKDIIQHKKNIYELAINYLKLTSLVNDYKYQQICIEVFPNVYLNLDNYTNCKTTDDGKVYLTNDFDNGNIEVIIDDNSIVKNKKTQQQITKIQYSIIDSQTTNKNNCYSSLDHISYKIDNNKKKNFFHKEYQFDKELNIIQCVKKCQSYVNNLARTAKYKKIKTPLALCGFDMFDKNRCCLCRTGCCNLDDVAIDNQETKITT